MTIFRSEPAVIRIAAAVIVDGEGRALLVRKRGTQAFMQAGGKIGAGELPVGALTRELREELGCEISSAPRPLGSFRAAAANEMGSVVEADLFAVELTGDLTAGSEIEEACWHHPGEEPPFQLAPLTRDHVLPLVRAWPLG